MYIKTTKQLFAAMVMLSAIFAQNDGLVVTKYDNGGIKVEGNYTNGVRNGEWAEYWEEVWWYDYGEDGEANTKDTLENNNRWDSVEVVNPDFKPKLKLQGNYLNGNMHAELIGPNDGFFKSDELKLGIFLLEQNIFYKDHKHAAPEIYLNLTNGIKWRIGGGNG